jgi:hypothetical protein
MSVTLTATPAPATGSVQLRFTGTGSVIRIERADANGTTDVRTLPGVLPWTYAAADLIIDDYEPAQGAVTYTALVTSSPAPTVSASLSFDLGAPWLFVPLQPAYSAKLKTITNYSASRESRSSVHNLINRPDPVVISRNMAMRKGQLEAYAGDFQGVAQILDACDRGEILMLRQPEHAGMDMYFTAEKTSVSIGQINGAGTLWLVGIDYVETARPLGSIAGALGWTFAGLAASAPDFATMPRRYATFEDMRLDQRISA